MADLKSIHSQDGGGSQRGSFLQLSVVMIAFLLAVGLAERMIYYFDPVKGLKAYASILVGVVLIVSLVWDRGKARYLLGLAIVPMMRILSLALPLLYFPTSAWLILVGLILTVGVLILAQRLDFTSYELGLNTNDLRFQLLVGLSGVLLGAGQFIFFKPAIFSPDSTLVERIGLGLALVAVSGYVEELIFRGLLQQIGEKILGRYLAWIYIAALYALLSLGSYSLGNVAFTFAVSLFYSWAVSRSQSIVGVSLSHGLASITLFIIMPGFFL